MIDVAAFRAQFVAKLQSIPTLIRILGNDDCNIVEYTEQDNGDLYSTIRDLKPPKVLVFLQGIGITGYPGLWTLRFGIALRVNDPVSLAVEIVNGKPSGSDLPMLFVPVNDKYHPMQFQGDVLVRQSIPLSDTLSFDLWQMNPYFTSRGIE